MSQDLITQDGREVLADARHEAAAAALARGEGPDGASTAAGVDLSTAYRWIRSGTLAARVRFLLQQETLMMSGEALKRVGDLSRGAESEQVQLSASRYVLDKATDSGQASDQRPVINLHIDLSGR